MITSSIIIITVTVTVTVTITITITTTISVIIIIIIIIMLAGLSGTLAEAVSVHSRRTPNSSLETLARL